VARWRDAREKIEWLSIEERWNPEVAIVLGTAARYRRAEFGGSYDDAHPDNPILRGGCLSTPWLRGESLLRVFPHGPWQSTST